MLNDRLRRPGASISVVLLSLVIAVFFLGEPAWAAAPPADTVQSDFPRSLDSYQDAELESVAAILVQRIKEVPFNLFATLIFFCAIIHTFMASKFMLMSHAREQAHEEKINRGEARENTSDLLAGVYHFLGEIEVVFGLWVVPLLFATALVYDWSTVVSYVNHGVNFTEAAFVIVIMVLASTRPILKLAELLMLRIAHYLGGTLAAFWVTVMTVGPLLGSLITEPAAMTISALLLSRRFYDLGPSTRLKYATLGLLFVNVSVGGTFTHFAAPPVLMVVGPWEWSTAFMLVTFGWKALVGILVANGLYFLLFRKEFGELQDEYALRLLKEEVAVSFVPRDILEEEWIKAARMASGGEQFKEKLITQTETFAGELRERIESSILEKAQHEGQDPGMIREAIEKRFNEVRLYRIRKLLPGLLSKEQRPEFQDPEWDNREDPVPAWIMAVHVLFMVWTIVNVHHQDFVVLGLLFFLGFAQVTTQYQNRINLKPAMLVGFFLAGLVIHGGLQGWWIAPVLDSLSEVPLMLGATILTAFNDNAAITYLSTLVPDFTDSLKYAVVAGAVTGGGLTVIANAPNPAGQSLLKKHFDFAVSPRGLLLGALAPTIILWICFALL